MCWPSHSPDLNQLENLWQGLKFAVHRHFPSNQTKLEVFYKEEWANISISICASLVKAHLKRLAADIAAKGGSIKYWLRGLNTFAHHTFLFLCVKIKSKTMYHFPSTSQLCTNLCWSITQNPNKVQLHLWLKCDKMWKSLRGLILLQGTVYITKWCCILTWAYNNMQGSL